MTILAQLQKIIELTDKVDHTTLTEIRRVAEQAIVEERSRIAKRLALAASAWDETKKYPAKSFIEMTKTGSIVAWGKNQTDPEAFKAYEPLAGVDDGETDA